MALAQSSPIGRIDPSSLIGKADPDIVSPRAVAVLSDAFRSGQISANDIHDRVSERAQAKEKMEITLANRATAEANDPALIEARRQQMLAAGAQGQLAGAQATSDLGMVPLTAKAKQEAIEKAAGEAKYPAAKDFDELAAVGGVRAVPLTPTGAVDYAKKAEIGAQLKLWKTRQDIAKNELADVVGKESDTPTGTSISSWTKQGLPVDPEIIKRYKKDAVAPFVPQDLSPGSVLAPIAPPAVVPTTVPPTDLRSTGEGDVNLPVQMTVEPKTTAAATLPTVSTGTIPNVGAPLAGGGYQLGTRPPKDTGAGGLKMTGEQAAQLAKGGFTVKLFENLRGAQGRLQQESPWLTGPVAGTVANVLFAHKWDVPVADFEAAKTAIMAPMVKGIFQETGVLSNVDIARYNKVLPSLDQTPAVQKMNIDNLEMHIYDSIITNYRAMEIQGQEFIKPGARELYDEARQRYAEILSGKGQSISDAASGVKPTAAAGAPATPTPVAAPSPVQTLSTGKKGVRDAQGNWVLAK